MAACSSRAGSEPMRSARVFSVRSKACLALVATLAACASSNPEPVGASESWRGATYDQVLIAWGAPSQTAADSHTWLSGGCARTLAFRDGRVVDGRWVGAPALCEPFARRSK